MESTLQTTLTEFKDDNFCSEGFFTCTCACGSDWYVPYTAFDLITIKRLICQNQFWFYDFLLLWHHDFPNDRSDIFEMMIYQLVGWQ